MVELEELNPQWVIYALTEAAKLPAHLRDRTFFNLRPYQIILSQPFDLDDATNDRLTYYIAPALTPIPTRPTFRSLESPSGELLANVAHQLGTLTGNTLLDWGLLSGILRAVARRLRSEDIAGRPPVWYSTHSTEYKQAVSQADYIIRACRRDNPIDALTLPNAERYALPSLLQAPKSLGEVVYDDVSGGYGPVPWYLMPQARTALARGWAMPATANAEVPKTIAELVHMLESEERTMEL